MTQGWSRWSARALVACVLAAQAGIASAEDVSVVAKVGGIPWFNAMEAGIRKAGRELGIASGMVGPTEADAAQQVRAVEDLIARRSKVIAVVPNDARALEPVFRRARSAGIKVLTHESPDQKGADWNIELSSVAGFGERHMDSLGKAMGGEGTNAVFVG
jgi:simple sugar transport system substrate-binding protein